jgi:hypothetical protein
VLIVDRKGKVIKISDVNNLVKSVDLARIFALESMGLSNDLKKGLNEG